MSRISLILNGRSIHATAGMSILTAAHANGVRIPTLCYLADLNPEGSCRVCVVEVEGLRNLVTACTYPISEGMIVHTDTPRVRQARRLVVELLLANHPLECPTCQRSLDCELQTLARELGVREIRFAGEKRCAVPDTGNPFIMRDNEKCILCGRCVRVCKEMQGCNALEWTERGFNTQVTTPFGVAMEESTCVFCGTCVSACPVGALVERPTFGAGEADRKVRTTCPFCGVGCNFDLLVKDDTVIGIHSSPGSAVNGRLTCVKGRFGTDYIHSPERLATPLIRKGDTLVPASWDEALALVAERFGQLRDTAGGDSLAALSSARCTNEENYLLQKFMRAVIGTNNVDHCART